MSAQEWKEKGNNFLKNKNYDEALRCYTEAIKADPNDHVHYSNRSACYFNMQNYKSALEDGIECVKRKSDWSKGYLRKGMAESKLEMFEEALETYKKGLQLEPNNSQLKEGLKEVEDSLKNPFTKNYSKLYTDPKTSKYMTDPQFKNLLDYAMKDQKVLMQLIQTDPRFMDVFGVLTGIDITSLNEEAGKSKKKKDEDDKERKIREEEERKRNEEEKRRREEQERINHMSVEEKEEETKKRKSEEIKLLGNEQFKKGNWQEAVKLYSQAIEIDPKELSFYLNRSGAYHNLKEYDSVIQDCNYVLENTFDFQKRSRAFGKIAYAYQEKQDLDKAIEFFEKSLLENSDQRIKDALKETHNLKRKTEAERYLNPELAEEHNNKANELYKAGKFPDALKDYNETIKRNPANPKYYSNRAACYMKLLEFPSAAKDCEKALELDSKFLKAHQRKATCQMMMKEYHKAIETYEKGLKLFPEDKELKDGYHKVFAMINSSSPE